MSDDFGVPLSADAPIAFVGSVHPPSEPREETEGPLVFLAEGLTESVYQFDFGRGRMLGPAPRRIEVDSKPHPLPGYPVLVGDKPPQGATKLGNKLVVAGGDAGTLVVFEYDQDGLRSPVKIDLPAAEVMLDTGERVSIGTPFVVEVVPLGMKDVIALARDTSHRTTVAYEVDIDAHRVLNAKELPFGEPLALASFGERAMATLSKGILAIITHDLVVRTVPAPRATMAALDQAKLYVGVNDPARLLEIDPETGSSRELFRAESSLAGPMLIDELGLWWALPSENRLLRLTRDGKVSFQIPVCSLLKHLVAVGGRLLATCLQESRLVAIDPDKRSITRVARAGSPTALVAA